MVSDQTLNSSYLMLRLVIQDNSCTGYDNYWINYHERVSQPGGQMSECISPLSRWGKRGFIKFQLQQSKYLQTILTNRDIRFHGPFVQFIPGLYTRHEKLKTKKTQCCLCRPCVL